MRLAGIFHIFATVSLIIASGCNSDSAPSGGGSTPLSESSPLPEATPRIDGFSPRSGNAGTAVTLQGEFAGVKSVRFGSLPAASFSVSADGKALVAVAPTDVDTAILTAQNSLGIANSALPFESYCNPTIIADQSLVITDLSVANDPVRTVFDDAKPDQGVWSFAYLLDQMRPTGQTFSDFTLKWLNQWKTVTSVNSFAVPSRAAIDSFIASWPKLKDGTLDPEHAPFRLLAITNRVDLRTAANAGEGRLVFGAVSATGAPLKFTVIFEYRLLFANGESLASWALKWHDLSLEAFPSAEYNAKLAALTDSFTRRNFAGQPNSSAIGQVRTNEIFLANPWELREFRLDAGTGLLNQTTVTQTPDITLRGTTPLDDWMLANATAIQSGVNVVPPEFLGGAAPAPSKGFVWTTNASSGVPEPLRKAFSLRTCNGCHSGETGTSFTHVGPRALNLPSARSTFLQNDTLNRLNGFRNLIIQNQCL